MGDTIKRQPSPWRWMVLFSRFAWTFIGLGCFKSLGVFIPYFVDSFSTTSAVAGLVCSSFVGFGMVTASPFVGALMKVWDPRTLTMVGGAVTASSMIVASFSSSMTQLAAWFTLASIGLAFIQVSTIKPIMDYFPDDFAAANGISLAGGTIGMMVIPPMVEYLVSLYGWRSALGLIGALSFNYVVSGALLRPLNKSTLRMAQYRKVPNQSDGNNTQLTSRKNIIGNQDNLTVCGKVLQFLRERFDTELLTEPEFVFFQVVAVLSGMIYSPWHLFIIPQGMEQGYGDSPSAFLATFAGIGSLIGRLGHGILIDRDLLRGSTLYVFSSLVMAVSCLLEPLVVSSYIGLAAVVTISGIAVGVMLPLMFVLMREITGDQRTSAFGWVFLSHGVGQIIGGFCAGWVHDLTGQYQFVFMTIGAVALAMSILFALTQCLVYYCSEPIPKD